MRGTVGGDMQRRCAKVGSQGEKRCCMGCGEAKKWLRLSQEEKRCCRRKQIEEGVVGRAKELHKEHSAGEQKGGGVQFYKSQ